MTMKAEFSLQASDAQGHTTTHVLGSALQSCWVAKGEVSWQLRTPSCLLSKAERAIAFRRTERGCV